MGNSLTNCFGQTAHYSNYEASEEPAETNRSTVGASTVRDFRSPHSDSVTTLTVDGHHVYSGDFTGTTALLAQTGRVAAIWQAHQAEVTRLCCREQVLYSGSRDTKVKAWTWDGQLKEEIDAHELTVTGLDANEQHLCSGARDNWLKLWDRSTMQLVANSNIAQNLVTCLRFSPADNNVFCQTSEDKAVRLWDSRQLSVVAITPFQRTFQNCCAFHPTNANTLLTGNQATGAAEAHIWDARMFTQPTITLVGHTQRIQSCCFVERCETCFCVTASDDQTVRVWDAQSGKLLTSLTIPGASPMKSIESSHDQIVVSGFDKSINFLRLNVVNSVHQLDIGSRYA